MALRFISCNHTHLSALRQISVQTFREAFAGQNTEENMVQYLRHAFSKEQLTAELDNPESHFLLANAQRQNVGYLKVNTGAAQSEARGDAYMELERIYVKSIYHGKGFGKELLLKAMELAREQEKKVLWLGVWEKNAGAIAFYEYFGFRKFGEHHFMLGSEDQLDHLMEVELK